MLFIRFKSTHTLPGTGFIAPITPVPEPKGIRGIFSWLAIFTTFTISWVSKGFTTAETFLLVENLP